MKNLRTHN